MIERLLIVGVLLCTGCKRGVHGSCSGKDSSGQPTCEEYSGPRDDVQAMQRACEAGSEVARDGKWSQAWCDQERYDFGCQWLTIPPNRVTRTSWWTADTPVAEANRKECYDEEGERKYSPRQQESQREGQQPSPPQQRPSVPHTARRY
jgi:hypothetical protein